MNKIIYKKASLAEANKIMALYSSLVGTTGCSWNEYYPDIEIVRDDASRGSLFCAVCNDEIIAAAAYENYDDLFELDIWLDDNAFALLRVGVKSQYQHQGIARGLLEFMFEKLSADYSSAHLLVNPQNESALALYTSMNFTKRGETDFYDKHWICMEKQLSK